MINGPFKTGNEPTSITIDPRGMYIYVTNSLDSIGFGLLHLLCPPALPQRSSTPAFQVAATPPILSPVSIIVEPALGRYVYTANYLGNSDLRLQAQSQYRRLDADRRPRPIPPAPIPPRSIAVPHGNHATAVVTP